MKVRVYKALQADIASPYVWIDESLIPEKAHRCYFRIARPAGEGHERISIVCQAYRATSDYKRRFEEAGRHAEIDGDRFIVMSEHYRNCLGGLEANKLVNLELKQVGSDLRGAWLASKFNPNRVERLALLMGFWSIIVSVLSMILGIISLL